MGVNTFKSHMQSDSHKSPIRVTQSQQFTMPSYFNATDKEPSAVTSTATTTTNATAAGSIEGKSSDFRAAFSSNVTLQADVLWCLITAEQHLSYASNAGISELFQAIFPDSQIAKSFTWGKD
ncbi:hypothetical protein E1301_Tti023628 [Triplophysa tibetana]|uniref:Uncharacterized protein n=1 Tax=Triplophysa tibetana TaxID=1572043 RepID=A0A5A9PKP8_9TELE|nr:hypothetical protein E1301_Tti023628 [Triplophysa tibetana]